MRLKCCYTKRSPVLNINYTNILQWFTEAGNVIEYKVGIEGPCYIKADTGSIEIVINI